MRINYVVPLLMGIAFLIIGWALPESSSNTNPTLIYILLGVGVILVIASYFIARTGSKSLHSHGGQGGKGRATGENSEAIGGAGGNANGGIGGDGGNAYATGKGSRAKGGAGGTG